MDVLTSLADRRDALEQRQRDLDLRANIIAATEKRVDGKIGELKTLQAKIEALLGQRDAKELEQLDGLVKVYTAMKPKDAARIFASLDDSVRLGVAGRMKPDVVAGIMAALPPEVAQKLSLELASRYKAPAPAAPAAPAPSASAAPAAPATPGG
jgi:flagellar motility protein MotE (MotC chaperone)